MDTRKIADFPGGKRFRFDNGQAEKGQVSADEILDSMNRSLKAEEILGYDPQLDTYLTSHSQDHAIRRRGSGRLVLAITLASGVIAAYLYGILGKLMQVSYWKTSLSLLGYNIPIWMIGGLVLIILLMGVASRRRSSHLTVHGSIDY